MSNRLWIGLSAVLFIVLMTLLLASPLWQLDGLPGGTYDAGAHIHRSAAMYRSFEQGVYWPRWFPGAYTGLGEPTFHHYSPGFYWLAAAAQAAGFRFDHSLKLVVTVALALSAFGVYAWLRYAFSPAASLSAAALYLLHPHILTRSLYYVGDYPRLLAYLLLPVCMWACTALFLQFRVRYWVAMIVSLAALLFSHTLTALLGSTILVLYSLLLAAGYRKPGGLLRCAGAMLQVALLSASFWLPAFADLSLVQIGNLREGYYHFSGHFLSWWELFVVQTPLLDSRAGNPLKPITMLGFDVASRLTFAAGIVSVLFTARRRPRVWGLAGLIFAAVALALTQQSSEPLWYTIPGLSLLQFPFRFLSIAPLGLLPAAALAVDAWPAGRRWLPALALMLASFLVLLPYLFPANTSSVPPVTARTAYDGRLLEEKSRMRGTTGNNEFLVRGADLNVATGREPEPNATRLTWHSPHEAVANVAGQPEPMILRLHYHPGWSAGERATLTQGPFGWIQVTDVRNPDEPLVVRWEGTVAQRWGEWLSLVGLFAFVAGLLILLLRDWGLFKWSGRGEEERWIEKSDLGRRFSTLTLSAMVGCAVIFVLVSFALDRSSGGPFLLHSPPGQLVFTVKGQPVTLGDDSSSQVTLLGWELVSPSTPKPGGKVRARLYWQGHGQINEYLQPFLHLYTPALQRSWAVENEGVGRPDTQWWDPDKYYVDDLLLFLPHDLPPATYSLVAGMVSSSGERLTAPGSADNLLYLRRLDVAPIRPGFLQRERPTTAARAATDDGLRLQGFDLLPAAGSPTLRLFWETGDGVANDWITFIHLYNPSGERIAQFDGPALAGLLPTSQWHSDAIYIDRRKLDLPTGLQPGLHLLRIGLYSLSSGERLALRSDEAAQRHFEDGQLLIPLTVAPSTGPPE